MYVTVINEKIDHEFSDEHGPVLGWFQRRKGKEI